MRRFTEKQPSRSVPIIPTLHPLVDLHNDIQVVHDKEQSINVTEENLKDFVGKPVFSR